MTKPHRILIIGVGSIGERHLRCFQNSGRAELALCEVNPELRQAVAERYGNVPAYENFDAAREGDFTAAAVAAPAQFHVPMSTELV